VLAPAHGILRSRSLQPP